MKILFDTNILVDAHNIDSPFNQKALEVYNTTENICITHQNLLEFYSVITNDKRVETPVTNMKAQSLLKFYSDSPKFNIISPNINTIRILNELATQYKFKGVEIFDMYIVATMISNDISMIYTADTKIFKKFKSITVLNPLLQK
jgi:predicted nucleic acid-binding protein